MLQTTAFFLIKMLNGSLYYHNFLKQKHLNLITLGLVDKYFDNKALAEQNAGPKLQSSKHS